MDTRLNARWWWLLLPLLAAALWFKFFRAPAMDQAFQQANGRIEATEIAIASKISGRIDEILVNEGDFVEAGQLLARINPDALQADLAKAKAQQLQSSTQVASAESAVAQRQSERAALEAALNQRQAELAAATKREQRTDSLVSTGAVSQQQAEDNQTAVATAKAAFASVQAQLDASAATIRAAETQVEAAKANLVAANAAVARIEVDLKETELTAPKAGRIQYRVLQPGEIVAAGGRVLNLIDLTDVFMTFFLPTQYAGLLTLKSEARIIVDALPDRAIPAKITFIADVAQFTPKTVETKKEREKLMFRIKAQVSPELLQKHIDKVKTGLPGVVWVRLDEQASWPAQLPPLVQP